MSYTEAGLPFSGATIISRHNSYKAATVAQRTRGAKTQRYLDWLAEVGTATDQGAAECLGWPLSSICSIRNGCRDQVEPVGSLEGRYGRTVTLWRRRVG